MSFVISKKVKYSIYALVQVVLLYFFSFVAGELRLYFLVGSLLFCVLGGVLIHLPINSFKLTLPVILLHIHAVIGALLSLVFFPNLSKLVVVGALGALFVITYAIALMNNIFLVVQQKNELIPLYRVAVTWSQILIVVVCIPYFAGIFKVPIISVFQSLIISGSTFLFSVYTFWSQRFDEDSKVFKIGDVLIGSFLVSFVVFSLSISVSFIPTESFLLAMFDASILMSGIGYLQAHLKNKITNRFVFEYSLVTVLFLLLLLVFKP
ncbi:MAG: hypothetical protein ACOZAO_05580 [Patescibacteria group bacterium]